MSEGKIFVADRIIYICVLFIFHFCPLLMNSREFSLKMFIMIALFQAAAMYAFVSHCMCGPVARDEQEMPYMSS